ncbi:MAG TPA: pilus assembly protein N-terminal domain-containing protein [Luteitalea sp.]|nr:pilus assembly protein N-terminal domain-containing protein [Luteitalea sp.]
MLSLPSTVVRLARVLLAALCAVAVTAPVASAQAAQQELTIYVNEVTTWSPGYAMGDIVLGSPATAGYEPTGGRRQLMLRGKQVGRTTLNIWDQKKTLRHEITLVVTTREAEAMMDDLKALLAPYPNVTLRRLGGQLLLTGTVTSPQDLAAVQNIAQVARAQSTVTLVGRTAVTVPGTSPATTPTSTTTPGGGAVAAVPAGTPAVEYELELFEASSQFKTGEYGRGVEPSGRSLYKGKVTAAVGTDGEIFIGGRALDPGKNDKDAKDTGIRLKIRPREGQGDSVVTTIEVETNVPLDYDLYDPEVWRRSRYAFKTVDTMPFAVSGNDLLAAPAIAGGMSAMGKVQKGTNTAARVPGASKGGLQYVPVFGSLFGSSSYKQKKTQILVVFRPTMTTVAP